MPKPSNRELETPLEASDLQKAAELFATALRNYAPKAHIRQSVKIQRIETRAKSKIIVISMSPDALAYDTGSGIHAQRGTKRKYIIEPKRASLLAFHWPTGFQNNVFKRGIKFAGISKTTGKYLFRFVEHPGVAGTNYISRAKKENREEIKNMAAANTKKKFRLYLQAVADDFNRSLE